MTTRAGTGTEGFSTSVRDRARSVETNRPRPKTETEELSDFYFAEYKRKQAAERAEEQHKQQARVDKECREKSEQQRRQKQGDFWFKEELIADTWARFGLTPSEIRRANSALVDDIHNLDRANLIAQEIVEQRWQESLQEETVDD